jgi:NtrC-family two-component system sensor histidine kinase KinB
VSLRLKLLLAQVPLAVGLGLLGLLASATTASLGRLSSAILKDNYRSVLATEQMKDALERLQDEAVLALVPGRSAAAIAPTAQRERFERALKVEEGNITEHGEAAAAQRLRALWIQYQDHLDRLRALAGMSDARAFFFDDVEPVFGAVRDAVDTVLAINQDAMVRKSDRAEQAVRRFDRSIVLASLLALGLGGILSIVMTNRVLQPLESLARTVQRIGEGDLDVRVEVPGRDEIASLAANVNAMTTRLSHYRRSSLGELLLAQQATQAAIDSLPDPVVVFDVGGNVLNVNQAAETLLGVALGPSAGDPLERVDAPLRTTLQQVRAHVLGGKGAYAPAGLDDTVRTVTGDGERYYLPRATPVYDERGSITGATVLLQDVTRLRRVDELRNDLVATVAHEFRTPLTSLRMAIYLCIEHAAGPLTEKQADLLFAARTDCERLQRMVDELLDISRIESGRIELARQPVAPSELVANAIEAHRGSAGERGVRLETAVLPDLEEVLADRERLDLVLSNLIGNAVRHSPQGGVVTVRALPHDGSIRFEVHDSGAGIAPEHQRVIFDKFVRLPGVPVGSAGLGLSIAKEIVLAHGGTIGVSSAPGQGATFWFTVPSVPGPAEDAATS